MCNDSPKFDKTKNDYYTSKSMWKNIEHLIPKDKVIWECCMLNSKSNSMEYWKDMGYKVVGNKSWDCLNYYPINYDIIISNPPFETKIKQKILKHLVRLDKPFILVLNCMNFYAKYFRDIFGDKIKDLQTIIPQGKITFETFNEETNELEPTKKQPSFYCGYLCYKMNFTPEQLWLKNENIVEYVDCKCGCKIKKSGLKKHLTSKKHLKIIEKMNKQNE